MARDVLIRIQRRTNDPAVIWEFESAPGVAADLTGSVFELIVAWPGVTLVHSSDAVDGDGVLILTPAAGRVSWPYTRAESETIPRASASYELFRTIAGRRRLWCGGRIEMMGFLP